MYGNKIVYQRTSYELTNRYIPLSIEAVTQNYASVNIRNFKIQM